MYSTADSIISEVKSFFEEYVSQGFVNDDELFADIVRGMKRFGNDLTEKCTEAIEIRNGFGLLPENLHTLRTMDFCKPRDYRSNCSDSSILVNSPFFVQHIERNESWDVCDPSCKTVTESFYSERIYLDPSRLNNDYIELYYDQGNPVSIRKARGQFVKVDKFLVGRKYQQPCYEVEIDERNVMADFQEGTLLLTFLGYPSDADGKILVPYTSKDGLERYLEAHLKRRTIENLIAREKAGPGITNLYPVIKQEEDTLLKDVSGAIKMSRLRPRELSLRHRRLNRLETLPFEITSKVWH